MAKCPNSRFKFSIAIQNLNSLQHLKFLVIIQCSCFFNYNMKLFGSNINNYEKCKEDSNSCKKILKICFECSSHLKPSSESSMFLVFSISIMSSTPLINLYSMFIMFQTHNIMCNFFSIIC